jgi:phosphoribosyl-ATP pyrophosphohydrolase
LIGDLEQVFQEIYEESEEEAMLSGEGLEKTVCKNFYDFIYHIPQLEDSYNDMLSQKIA